MMTILWIYQRICRIECRLPWKRIFADKYSTSELTDDDIDSFVEDAMCGSIGDAETLIGCDMMNKVLENQYLNLSKVSE